MSLYTFRSVSDMLIEKSEMFQLSRYTLSINFSGTLWACTQHPASNPELQALFARVLSHIQISQYLVNN